MDEVPSTESTPQLDSFLAKWTGQEGGQERADYHFLTELCQVLAVPAPDPAAATTDQNDYVFERLVHFRDGRNGRIDLYKRGSFVLEAKQSRQRGGTKEVAGQGDLLSPATALPRGRRSAERAWDVLMMNARRQAEDYALALPSTHDWPPFILVCDIGHAIKVFADFSGKGRNYSQFPDRQGFRIYLEDLREPEIRERLRLIWTDPQALDPTQRAAEATRAIALRLAAISKLLEAREFNAEEVAHFLMRCLFTMFAEDTKLLPENAFTDLLERCIEKPENFPRMVGQLWEAMNAGGFAFAIEATVRRFNGEFFRTTDALPLNREEIGELLAAAKADWKTVEPAIFGTLLEQALDPAERRRLGAHYTPRAYVERLVLPTIVEPLREDWRNVLDTAEKLNSEGKGKKATELVRAFHAKLCDTRILDPACGTGNFLYVSLELMKRLEGEVLEALADLGGQEALSLERQSIDPHPFLGMEINPRAAAIAELVLWIGFLQWHFRTRGEAPGEPILQAFHNIRLMDAVLTWDGWPVPKIVDGEETYPNAGRPAWPEAEFIVGNPPFMGGKDIRSRQGAPYAETLWRVHSHMNKSADYVMYWWDRAADLLSRKGSTLRRFGSVTTNSISQVFQRRVVARHLQGRPPISLVMAIPDHPWTKSTADAAAVRIAMTVAVAGRHDGALRQVVREEGLASDTPMVEISEEVGAINSNLSIGVDRSATAALTANRGLCSPGVKLHGDGFIVTPAEAEHLGLGRRPGLERHIRLYRNGRDLTARPRNVMVIDLLGVSETEVRQRFPELYQYLTTAVRYDHDENSAPKVDKTGRKTGREWNRRVSYKQNWWVFGEPRKELRPALDGLTRYIATVETAKHRFFQFLDASILPDNMLVAIATDDAFHLGVLTSTVHVTWATAAGGWQGVGNDPRYSKSRCFDPFPFPEPVDDNLKLKMRAAAEELDATRKRVLDEHPDLSTTGLYNVLERLTTIEAAGGNDAEIPPLSDEERDVMERGLVLIIKELHHAIDRLVFEAYNWPCDLSDQAILEGLVALNKKRASEEKNGLVRWLRPDYQIPRFETPGDKERQLESDIYQHRRRPRAEARQGEFSRRRRCKDRRGLRGLGQYLWAGRCGRYRVDL